MRNSALQFPLAPRTVPNWCNGTHDCSARTRIGLAGTIVSPPGSESFRDGVLGVLLNGLQMVLVAKTLGIDLVNVLGA